MFCQGKTRFNREKEWPHRPQMLCTKSKTVPLHSENCRSIPKSALPCRTIAGKPQTFKCVAEMTSLRAEIVAILAPFSSMAFGLACFLHFDVQPVMNKSQSPGQNLGDFSRQTVQRYLSTIEGHPAAQLHRLIMNEVEKPLLVEVLKHCCGNLTHAAELLGMNRATLRKKLDEHGIVC